jgi:hypothetical protein
VRNGYSLLAQRNADPPTFRVEAQLPSEKLRERLSREFAHKASLEAEELANRRTRAGDIPYDLAPDLVPIDERYPTAGLEVSLADADALAHVRAIVTILNTADAAHTDTEIEHLDDLTHARFGARYLDANDLVGSLTSLLTTIDTGEHGIGNDLALRLEEPIRALTDLGLRAPFEALQEYYLPPPEPSMLEYSQDNPTYGA